MANLTSSEARKGERVTIHLQYGGVSLGYLVDGVVYETTGSLWAARADSGPIPMVSFDRDGGQGYMARARAI